MRYVEELRRRSEIGLQNRKRDEARTYQFKLEKQREADLAEAEERIEEAEASSGAIARATAKGECEAVVCVLRGGAHFRDEFRRDQSPKFLGTIGATIHGHFVSRGLKVSFKYWMDGMRIGELNSDTGYELVVSW